MHVLVPICRTSLNRLVRLAEAAEEIVLTYRERPAARIEPVQSYAPSSLGVGAARDAKSVRTA